jgi:hypothetical protein
LYYTSSNQCELHSTSPVNAIAQNSEFHLSTCLRRLRLLPVADTEPFARAQLPAFLGFDLACSVLTRSSASVFLRPLSSSRIGRGGPTLSASTAEGAGRVRRRVESAGGRWPRRCGGSGRRPAEAGTAWCASVSSMMESLSASRAASTHSTRLASTHGSALRGVPLMMCSCYSGM